MKDRDEYFRLIFLFSLIWSSVLNININLIQIQFKYNKVQKKNARPRWPPAPSRRPLNEEPEMLPIMFRPLLNRPPLNPITLIPQEHPLLRTETNHNPRRVNRTLVKRDQAAWWVDCKAAGWKRSDGGGGVETGGDGGAGEENVWGGRASDHNDGVGGGDWG